MQKQFHPIKKTDWCITVANKKDGKGKVQYLYAQNRAEAREMAKQHKGFIQYFKLSYEFKTAAAVGVRR